MKMTRFEINNFKSLTNFSLPLSNFTCLIGLNGSGKSTVLQALDFLSHLLSPDIDDWLRSRGWEVKDLLPAMRGSEKMISFKVELEDEDKKLIWYGDFNRNSRHCQTEKLLEEGTLGKTIFEVSEGHLSFNDSKGPGMINFKYTGSILSRLLLSGRGPLNNVVEYFLCMKSLDLLAPHLLKANSRDMSDIGSGGERFPSFLSSKSVDSEKLLEQLKAFYPQVEEFVIKRQKGGIKKLLFREATGNNAVLEFEAKHINDGMLRVLAILSQAFSHRSLVMFDEIENGINSELMEKLVENLLNSPSQVLVTTHSPMLLNYLDDETAKKSVHLLYKKNGKTFAKPFFELPGVAEKLEYLGPGEAFVDVSLEEIVDGITEEGK